ncbi:hypothetical protein BH20CHL5_BH20CHL5_03510 [soil metagenome]
MASGGTLPLAFHWGETVVDWSPPFVLVPSLEVAYAWHVVIHAAEVANSLAEAPKRTWA